MKKSYNATIGIKTFEELNEQIHEVGKWLSNDDFQIDPKEIEKVEIKITLIPNESINAEFIEYKKGDINEK